MKPRFRHDCSGCQYLGTAHVPSPMSDGTSPNRWYDFYYCPKADGGSILASYASRDSAYASCMVCIIRDSYIGRDLYATACPALITGFFFAVAKGLIPRNVPKPKREACGYTSDSGAHLVYSEDCPYCNVLDPLEVWSPLRTLGFREQEPERIDIGKAFY